MAFTGSEGGEIDGDKKDDPDEIYLRRVELFATSTPSGEPASYNEAIYGPNADKRRKAMDEEYESLNKMGTFIAVPRPPNRKIVGSKWVYRHKRDATGEIVRYKARLVAKGYSQVDGIDFTDTYAPVTRLESIRLLLGIAVQKDWEIRQVDVKTAYLYGDLDEDIYMEPPEGYELEKGWVWHLKKAVYGLKQAGRQWYKKLKEVLTEFSMTQVIGDPNTFVAHKVVDGKRCTLILPIYVDDLIPIGDKVLTDDFEANIGKYFDVTILGDLNYFLGIRVIRDRSKGGLILDQTKFAERILERYLVIAGRANAKVEKDAPLFSNEKDGLVPFTGEHDAQRTRNYQRLLGCAMYLMLGTRPDLAYSVCKLARFASNPSEYHAKSVDRLFAYIRRTKRYFLHFQRDQSGDAGLEGFSDSDWAGDESNSKSVSGYAFFVAGAAFSWRSKQQEIVATSSAEAEYIALAHASCHSIWIKQFLEQLGHPFDGPLPVYCDNEAAVKIAKKESPFFKSKHIRLKYHTVRDHISSNFVDVLDVDTHDNLADIFTKTLPLNEFATFVASLGIDDMPPTPDPDLFSPDPDPNISNISVYTDAQDSENEREC